MFLLLLPYAIQIIFIVHAIRNGKNTTWIWLLIMLPYVGGAIYFFMEIVPDLRRGRVLDPQAFLEFVDKNAAIRRLQEQVKLSNTMANHIALADEYLRVGAHERAEEEYASQLAGPYRDDRGLQLKIARAAFLRGDHPKAAVYFDLANAQSPFTATDWKAWRAFSHFQNNPGDETLAVLESQFGVTKNAEVGWYYAQGLKRLGRQDKIPGVLETLRLQHRNLRGGVRAAAGRHLRAVESLLDK